MQFDHPHNKRGDKSGNYLDSQVCFGKKTRVPYAV